MGTNYYLRFKYKEEDKDQVKNLINNDRFEEARDLLDDMCSYMHYDICKKELVGSITHLGKRSSGWTFLWETNWFFDSEGKACKLYELNKESLRAYIYRDDTILFDEYGKVLDKDEFWQMALEWGQPDGWDYAKYAEHETSETGKMPQSACYIEIEKIEQWGKLGYETDEYGQEFYSDGLRFSTSEFR